MKHFAGDLVHNGWMRLPFQFSSNELDTLSELDPHIGRGQRLLDMQAVTEALPLKFKPLDLLNLKRRTGLCLGIRTA